MSARIVGCGNADRGDDAAGLLVVRRLREMGIQAREESGEGLALMASWEGAERVIVVDAVVTGSRPGSIHVWDARDVPLVRDAFPFSTHGFGVAEAVELARALDQLPPSLMIYGIEGREFSPGAAPSAAVLEAVEELARRLALELVSCTNPV